MYSIFLVKYFVLFLHVNIIIVNIIVICVTFDSSIYTLIKKIDIDMLNVVMFSYHRRPVTQLSTSRCYYY